MHAFVRGGAMMLLLGDFFVFIASLILTLLIRYQTVPTNDIVVQHLNAFLFLFVLWALVFLIGGLYDPHVSLGRKRIPLLVIRIQLINILLAALFFFMFPVSIAPKTNLVIYLFISTGLIVFWRLYIFPLITTRKQIKVLVVGTSKEAIEIGHVLASNPYFQHFKIFLQSNAGKYNVDEFRASMHALIEDEGVEMVIADMQDPLALQLIKDFYSLVFEGRNIRFFELAVVYELLLHRIPPSLVEEGWLLEHVVAQSPHYAYDFLKRAIDVIGAFVLLVPASILFPFIMLAIKLDDGGVILYRAARVGQHTRAMTLFKFRTMTGSDDNKAALQSTLRVTRVGGILRKTRLDELPQLWNVLRGDLSFIGPRPEIPTLVDVYAKEIPYYNTRHLIKPGLSGWAQINNFDVPRGGIDIPRTIDKLSFDLYYLKRRSLLLDIEIALRTINTLLMRTGT